MNDHYNYTLLFRRLNHLSTIGTPSAVIECEIALMLLNRHEKAQSSKLFSEIADYIQVRVASAPTVSGVAEKFGYNPDYLSKLFIKHTGLPLKKYIDSERNGFVKSLLINTNLSIKEIASTAAFLDHGALIKFFRYNNGITPTEFRAQNFATHTNNQ
ncbi:MAG: helix-turn-helix transcriptional regulator [Clostridia bacterium]|nr:helix-turn-helix transcriptional regulator [Clostridia bacterium]